MVEIVDHRGSPIRKRELVNEISGPTIAGTRSIWTSALTRDITPMRMAAILREAEVPGDGASERYVEFAEMMEERDLHYLGVVSTRKRQVARIGITVEPSSDRADDVRDADLVRECFERDELADELFDILDAITKGYSVSEIIWETSESDWRPARIEHRLPQWFDFDRLSGTRLQMRADEGGWVDLPAYKFICHTPRAKSGLAIRGGLARAAAFAWMAKTYTLRDWVQFSEVYGRPLRVGRYQPGASEDEKSVLYRAVRDIGVDAAAIMPESMLVEFVGDSSAGARSDMHERLIRYVDAQISIAVLGQTLTTQEGDSGSYALGAIHNQVRGDIEESDARQLAACLRRHIAVPIVTLNHGPRKKYPQILIERTSAPDLEMFSQALERLIPLGLRVRADQVRTMFGLDRPGDDDEVLEVASQPMTPPGTTDPPLMPPARARAAGGDEPRATAAAMTIDDDPIPALLALTRAAVGPLVDAWADRIEDELQRADSLSDFGARLSVLQAWTRSSIEPVPDVGDATAALQQALIAAHLAGRYDIVIGPTDIATASASAPRIALGAAFTAHTQLPFKEQIAFFRDKLSLGTASWTDIVHEQHDRSFVVAGAAHAHLIEDLRGAVDKGIAEGATLATFRADFDAIVAKHGWNHRGGRDWRTEVIYGTNLRTSYAAGRYRQATEIVDRRPYWRYRHSDVSEQPRHDHLAWDGLTLRHDDPWWSTHYPPNGWGCRCFVETLGKSDIEALGKSGPDRAPDTKTRTVTIGARGPNPQQVDVPDGIDPGWAYAPGRSVVQIDHASPWSIGELTRADATARRVGPQVGSNPDGLFQGADGRARYVKFYDDPTQSYGEVVANRAYRELGIDAPVSALVRERNAIVGVANEIIDHSGGVLGRGLPKGASREVLRGYSADVWLANWDAVGPRLDNVVRTWTTQNAVARINQGGALLTRAGGGRKPIEKLEIVSEWYGYADLDRHPAYARVLRAAGHESADELGEQALGQIEAIEKLGKRTDSFRLLAPAIRGVSSIDQAAIRELLVRRAGLLKSQIAPRVRAAITPQTLPSYQLDTKRRMEGAYHKYLGKVRQNLARGFESYGMTEPELVSLYAFTGSDKEWDYLALNNSLREAHRPGGHSVPAKYHALRLTLLDALARMPDHPAKGLRRGATIRLEELKSYTPGEIVTFPGFTSTSKGKGMGGNVRFTIDGLHGKDISGLSAHPGEQEILFRPETRFSVRRRGDDRGITYIELEEADDA